MFGASLDDRVIAEAEPPNGARAEVLDHDVGGVNQLPENLAAGVALEIQGKAALVPVDTQVVGADVVDERWSPGARVVPLAWLLDLDHLGAHVAQQHGAVGPGHDPGQIDDTNSVQRLHAHAPPSTRLAPVDLQHE